MNPFFLHLSKVDTSHRAFMASVALHGAGITAAILWLAPGFVSAHWAGVTQAPFETSIVDERQVGPRTSPMLPPTPVLAEAPKELMPLEEPIVEQAEQVVPMPVADHPPLPRTEDLLHAEDWMRSLLPTPPAEVGATAPPPEPQSSPAQAAVEPSPIPGHNAPPTYPWVAWRRGIEGTVVVVLEIDAAGAVREAKLEASSGSGLLDNAALQQLSTWRFEPAPGVPLRTHRRSVEFVLRDR